MPKKAQINIPKKQIKKVYQFLNTEEQELVDLYYGLKGQQLNLSQIAIMKGTSSVCYSLRLKKLNLKILKMLLENTEYKIREKYTYQELKRVLKEFSDFDQQIISLYYGLNDKLYSKAEISQLLQLTMNKVTTVISFLDTEISNLLEDSNYRVKGSDVKNREFSFEEILSIADKFEGRERQIIELYYLKYYSLKQIGSVLGISHQAVQKKLKKLNSEITLLLNKEDCNKIKYHPFTKDDITKVLSYFPKDDSLILTYYYGINQDVMSMEEIAQRLNIKVSNVQKRITILNSLIENMLESRQFYSASSLNYKREFKIDDIRKVLPYFEGIDKEILILYYGLKDKFYSKREIQAIENINYERLTKIINILNEKIKVLLVKENIKIFMNANELLVNNLTFREYNILDLRYRQNKSFWQISRVYNMEIGEVKVIIEHALNKLDYYVKNNLKEIKRVKI